MAKLTEEDKALKQKWLDQIAIQTVEDRLEQINLETDNTQECFNLFLRNKLFVKYIDKSLFYDFSMYIDSIQRAIANARYLFIDTKIVHIDWSGFVIEEINEVYSFIDYEVEGSIIHSKGKKYLSFLKANEARYLTLDRLQTILHSKSKNSLKDFFSNKLKKGFINLVELDKQHGSLFNYLDSIYNYNLVNNRTINILDKHREAIESAFDFEGYKNPIRLLEFPAEKLKFQKLLKTWFLEQLEYRTKVLEWKTIPVEYQFLYDYALSLVPTIEERKPKQIKQEVLLQHPEPEYPKHIFKDAQSFELFNFLMQYYKTPNTISFLYRIMAEIENPNRILVKDTPFREWFNKQNFEITLETHTKTYLGAKNQDRIITYAIAKKLIIKE
ncbi:hypothetical protein ACSVH2_09800 [Flavobacterium sp. RSB2_4_14]|uniref:hypothetical protein n=1 Tax=Flavobacterium sp. RSB2_4_14 TaxID=3447665 RepID=UPI003F2D143C